MPDLLVTPRFDGGDREPDGTTPPPPCDDARETLEPRRALVCSAVTSAREALTLVVKARLSRVMPVPMLRPRCPLQAQSRFLHGQSATAFTSSSSSSSTTALVAQARYALRGQQQQRSLFGLSKSKKEPKPPGWKPFYKRHPGWTAAAATPLVIVGSLGLTLLGLWAYDASTYHHPHDIKVPVDPLALNPERGGKKNLKIATALVDDLDDNRVGASGKDKKKLVIVGGGWAVSYQSGDLAIAPERAG